MTLDRLRPLKFEIKYNPKELLTYEAKLYEWIDNLHFTLNPRDCIIDPDPYLNIVKQRFSEIGWNGDGTIDLIWLPPFLLEGVRSHEFTQGVILWHVKQKEDGISWLLYPKKVSHLIKD